MNKQSLRFAVLTMVFAVQFLSCNKKNGLNPYPSNVRLLNFTRTTTYTYYGSPVYTENFGFQYNVLNQISQITYTTNNPAKKNLVSTFGYHANWIIDTTRDLNNFTLVEIDSFITDFKGNIDTSYILGTKLAYTYDINLLSRIDYPDHSFNIFTSYNGNFIKATASTYTGDASESTYTYYTDQFNRIGDYLQLLSVSRYSLNFDRTNCLVRSINSPTDSVFVTYAIDAENKITQVTAVKNDTFNNNSIGGIVIHPFSDTEIYKIQYETFH